jgi:tetratricopeptide (TPR) repeat protein
MNIELNFVNNANMELGRYDTAIESFNNVIKAKHDHPVALYYAGFCYKKLGNQDMSLKSFRLAENYARNNHFWKNIIQLFDIPIFQATETMEFAHE